MTAFVIYLGDVPDAPAYEVYENHVEPNILAAGGTDVVRGGDVDLLKGDLPARGTVMLEFPSPEAALTWYPSEEYAEIRRLRDGVARASVYVVDRLG